VFLILLQRQNSENPHAKKFSFILQCHQDAFQSDLDKDALGRKECNAPAWWLQ